MSEEKKSRLRDNPLYIIFALLIVMLVVSRGVTPIVCCRVGSYYPLFSLSVLLTVFFALDMVTNINNAVEKYNSGSGNEESVQNQ